MSRNWILFAVLAIGMLWTYFLVVFFLETTVLWIYIRHRYLVLMIIASFGTIYGVVQWACRRQLLSVSRLKDISIASITTMISIIGVDIGYSVYSNVVNQNSGEHVYQNYHRMTDRQIWNNELFPRSYYPTEKNFPLYKPKVTMSGNTFGGNYYRELIHSPTMTNSVLELRHIKYSIDEYGFRETTPLKQARIFALGDSFTFGLSTSQDNIWVEVLEKKLSQPIYNLGVFDTSPKQQLMLLEHMLQTKQDTFKIQHLLWMIFEGNDLEDSYKILRSFPEQKNETFSNLFRGTVIDVLASIPVLVKKQSVINRILSRRQILASPFGEVDGIDHYLIDGMRLIFPLYHSTRWGYRLFPSWLIEISRKSESYIMNHPNRPLLDQTFETMASLSKEHGFKVIILIAPSSPRLYAPYFENFPRISEEPHFINYVAELSNNLGFSTVNLYQSMQPYAEKELLFWRDDTHWNKRGNEVVAEIIAKHFMITQLDLNDKILSLESLADKVDQDEY